MTAPAVAPASGPIAPAAPRPAPQGAADPFAFGAVLDSLPSAPAKADAPATEKQRGPSNELARDESSRGETAHHSLLNDSALLAALPFALRAASMIDENPQAANSSLSSTLPEMKGPKSEDSDASLAAGAKAASVGRLVGERAFHFGPSTFTGAIASRALAVDTPFALDAVLCRQPYVTSRSQRRKRPGRQLFVGRDRADDALAGRGFNHDQREGRGADRSSIRRIPNKSREHHTSSRARADRSRTVLAPPPVARVATSAAAPAPAESSGKSADGRPPDPAAFVASATSANRPVRRAIVGALRRRDIVSTRRLDGQRRTRRRRAAREHGRRWLRPLDFSDQRDRRRSFVGRPRGCLDDDAARGRQALCRHSRVELSNPGIY